MHQKRGERVSCYLHFCIGNSESSPQKSYRKRLVEDSGEEFNECRTDGDEADFISDHVKESREVEAASYIAQWWVGSVFDKVSGSHDWRHTKGRDRESNCNCSIRTDVRVWVWS